MFVIGVIGQVNDIPNADQGLPVDRLLPDGQNERVINQWRGFIGRYVPEQLSPQYKLDGTRTRIEDIDSRVCSRVCGGPWLFRCRTPYTRHRHIRRICNALPNLPLRSRCRRTVCWCGLWSQRRIWDHRAWRLGQQYRRSVDVRNRGIHSVVRAVALAVEKGGACHLTTRSSGPRGVVGRVSRGNAVGVRPLN